MQQGAVAGKLQASTNETPACKFVVGVKGGHIHIPSLKSALNDMRLSLQGINGESPTWGSTGFTHNAYDADHQLHLTVALLPGI